MIFLWDNIRQLQTERAIAKWSYVVGVDVPSHVAVGDKLSIDVAANLTVPPAVVDVNDADHVPLKKEKGRHEIKIICFILFYCTVNDLSEFVILKETVALLMRQLSKP